MKCENLLGGADPTDWQISGSGDSSIQGFATDMSVDFGGTVDFKVNTDSANYRIDIYRLGYYGGLGARLVGTLTRSTAQSQPACMTPAGTPADPATGLYDCGNWAVSASWPIPDSAVSGIHIAKLTRLDGSLGSSHIYFIVRDDMRTADVLFQTSDTTWQAYNTYGGGSTYCGGPVTNDGTVYGCAGRAVKVSYNRPIDTRDHDAASFLFNGEYPMVRWLEANGYDTKYWSGVDTDRLGAQLTGTKKPKIFLSVGHDEYWSGAQRTAVENARNAGVSLAFLSGNEMYWKTRWEPSIAPGAQSHRTLVTYKETLVGAKIDPAVDPVTGLPIWTGTWRDTRFAPPLADGGRPENALIGQIWTVNCCTSTITVPASMRNLRLWQNTRVAEQVSGSVALAPGSLGYEWGEALENGFQPAGVIRMSSTTVLDQQIIQAFGSAVSQGTATHSLTLYRHNSGALVFGAGTVQWSWGLDGVHDDHNQSFVAHTPDQAMQQATVTLFADMGAQPDSLQIGADATRPLVTVTPSADIFAPTSTISSPAQGGTVESGERITITGTATDSGGGVVAGVEVSVNNGATWNKAQGASAWTFDWSPGAIGQATIRTRAIDDRGNLEIADTGTTVTIANGLCPCPHLFKPSALPFDPNFSDSNAYELGVKFRSDIAGFINGIRFYKGIDNQGTHLGNLWSGAGELLASAVFTNETGSGWQEVLFATPVAITANTLYVASYHTNVGHYAISPGYFANAGIDSPPLHAPTSGESGGNGVFASGASAFPSSTFNAGNYWVDVVFASTNSDVTPPVISNVKVTTIDSSKAEIRWTTSEAATSRVDYSTDSAFSPASTLTASSATFKTSHFLTLTGLMPNTTYYLRVTSVDGPGNSTTVEPPTITLPGPTLRDTAEVDFAAGTPSGTYVSGMGNGELILAPVSGTEFSGTSMPPGWLAVPWNFGGFATVANGALKVDGSRVGTCTGNPCTGEQGIYAPGHTLEFVATFTGDAFQHGGLAVDLTSTDQPWAMFSTLSGGNLYARTNTGAGQFEDFLLGGTYLGEPHRYRIQWKADGTVDYFVDGVFKRSSPLVVSGLMRPVAASDFSVFGGTVTIDWVRMTPHAPSGTFVSRVFDANAPVDWRGIQWTISQPASTTAAISLRTGDTAIPDASWSEWAAVSAPGPLTLRSRYIQYGAVLTSSDPSVTPALEDIIITTGNAPVAVADPDAPLTAFNVPENGSRVFPAAGPGSLTFNDIDADVNDVLRVIAVTAPSRGTTVLNADGSVTYTPAPGYSGTDAFSYTVSDGLLTSSAGVGLNVTFQNNAPEAVSDFYTSNEDTPLSVPANLGILANDTDPENNVLRVVLVTPPSYAASFSLSANGAFNYTPVASFAGPDIFTYKANDGSLDSAVTSVTILMNQVNDPPITEPDAYTAVLNQAKVVGGTGVLANDHDIEVEDIIPLRAQVVTPPTNGVLELNANGSFTYTPNSDYLGIDTFTYKAIDHFNAEGNVATVTMNVVLKAVSEPAAGGGTVSTGGGVNAGDPLQSAVTTPIPATVSIAQGVISSDSTLPDGFAFLNRQVNISVTDGVGATVTATPAAPFVFSFLVDLSLIPAGQDPAAFDIYRNGVRVPPCPGETSIPSANLNPCMSGRVVGPSSVAFTILTTNASLWHIGADGATIDPAQNDGLYIAAFQTPLVIPAPGVLGNDFGDGDMTALPSTTVLPEGGTVDLSLSGGFTFTPSTGFCGPAKFQYTAHSGTDVSNEGVVSILVNCNPVAVNDTATVLEDSGATMISVLVNDTDPDPGQTQSLRIDTVTQPANGMVIALPNSTWLTYEPNANFFGSDSFTYSVKDSRGGIATGTVEVTVTNVNDVPSFTKGANQTVLEDAATQSIAGWATQISAGPGGEIDQVDFALTNDNNALFASQPAVSAAGTLHYTLAPNAHGAAVVTASIHDNGGGADTSAPQTFTITATPVNDAPSFVKGGDQTLFEDTGAQTIAGWATQISAGPTESDQVTFVVTNDNTALFSTQPSIAANGTLSYDPAPNANGAATVTVQAQDNGGTANGGINISAAQTFTVNVSLLNDGPTFTQGPNQTVLEDSAAQTVPGWATNMSAGPSDETDQALTFTVTNNNNALFAAQPEIAPNGTLTFAAAGNVGGNATVTVLLRDTGGVLNGGSDTSVAHTFTIAVTPVNDAPSFTKGENQTVLEDTGAQTVAGWATSLSAGPADESGQALTFTVTNSNTALFAAQPAITGNGTLTFAPAANASGSATVTVQVRDNGGTANGGSDASASQTFTIAVTAINDPPTFTNGANQTVLEDSSAQTIAGWATSMSAGPSDEAGQTFSFIVSNDNNALFAAQPAIADNGTLTFAALANASGTATVTVQLRDNGATANGGSDTSAAQTLTISVTAVNDMPTFTKGANQSVYGFAGAQTVAGWATSISAGPGDGAQALTFAATNDNPALFSTQPSVASNGTLTYTAANMVGTATVTVTLQDNGGTANGGLNTSGPQMFSIEILPTPTTTAVSSSSNPSLFGVPMSLKATVAVVAPGVGVPAGTVTFRRGTTVIGSGGLVGGVATLNTSTLPTGTHSITASYAAEGAFAGSTSAALSQVITPSATLSVTFVAHAIDDNTRNPKVRTIAVPNALVKVFSTANTCTGNIWSAINAKKWGIIFDGADGVGGVDGCPVVTVGTYQATATTNANGVATILVPALALNLTNQYIVIARATNFDYIKTASSMDPLYSQMPVIYAPSGTVKKVPLSMLATFNGKIVPGKQAEFFGSYLNLIQPEYVEWTEDQEQYPFVMVAEGGWNVTTSVATPEGFIPDAPAVTEVVADTTTAVQFTITDIASEWSETTVQQTIVHNGETIVNTETVPMIDKKPTKANNDVRKIMRNGAGLIIDVMTNDRFAHTNGPITITGSTPALNGSALLASDGLSFTYTPTPGYAGSDTFTYTITDFVGTSSTATVTIKVLAPPEIDVKNVTAVEGHDGAAPVTVNVTLSNESLEEVRVNYSTLNGTAVAGDYVATSGSLTFAPGTTSLPITVDIVGDILAEAHETFKVKLAGPINSSLAALSDGTITITDDDPPDVSISATAATTERDFGTDNAAMVITLSQTHDESVWVNYVTAPGTALADSDYLHTAATVQFLPGTLTKTIYIPVVYDTVREATESFYVDLTTSLNGTLTEASRTTVTITDNDDALPAISIAATASITEANVGSDNVAVTVTMSQTHDIAVFVDYATAPGTALAGSDYTHTAATLQFPPGTLSKTIFIPVLYDTVGEGPESFYVDLSTPLNGTLTAATRATVNIVNDDNSSWVTATAADFAAGTLDGTAIAQQWDGELILRPTLIDDFLGSSLPAGWTSMPIGDGGAAVAAGGMVSVDGAALLTPSTYGAGRTLEVSATFRPTPNQSIGFGVANTLVSPMAMFVIDADRQLVVRTINGTRVMESPVAGVDWLGIPHRYGITWNAGTAQYLVDGVVAVTHSSMAWGAVQMRPVLMDGGAGDGALSVDWLRLSPHATPGTYTSRVFDGEGPVAWKKLTLTSVAASGTTQTLWYRMGDTETPDTSWSAFAAPASGGVLVGSSRYMQFQIRQASTAPAKTPTAKDVTVLFKR